MGKGGRNPLKSGQCFLQISMKSGLKTLKKSQSPQIGSMFLTRVINIKEVPPEFKIESQSPQIGSMFLTKSGLKM